MRLHALRLSVLVALWAAFVAAGCGAEILFGPGAIFGVRQTGTGVGGTTTQPNVIAAPTFASDVLDPVLEATAGARVVVSAQLNDDNGDGLIDDNDELDFVSGHDESQPIQIHLNDGGGVSFTTLSVAGGGPIAKMIDIQIADFDLDGRLDIAVLVNDTGFVPVDGAELRGAVVVLFNPVDTANGLAWSQTTVGDTFVLPNDGDGMTSFAVTDIDLDMESDGVTPKGPDVVLGSNEVGDVERNIRLYLNPGRDLAGGAHLSRQGGNWTGSLIESDAVPFQALDVADIDRDGDMDVVATFPTAKTFNVRWMVNPLIPGGAGAVTDPWSRRILGQQQDGGDFVDVADIDGDGDTDVAVVKTSEGLVQWFENPDDPNAGLSIVTQQTYPWRVFNLGKIQGGFSINQMQLVDLNLDGLVDCFLTASGNLVGFQRGAEVHDFWDAFSIVATDPVAAIDRCAFEDVNGDGLLDIIAPLDREGLTQDEILIFTRLTP